MPEESMAKIVSLIEEEKKKAWLKAIDEAHGKFKDSLSSSEDFMKRKEEEKSLDR